MAETDREKLRRQAREIRHKAARQAGDLVARAIRARALRLIRELPGEIISGYVPVKGEADVMPLMRALARAGRTLALPVVERPAAPLIFRRWEPGDELIAGAHGIPVPPESAPELQPDILLVPLLAFDRAGHRLGYGGGYYDRTLSALRARKPVTAIGIAHAEQEIPRIPALPTDARLDWIITGRETISITQDNNQPGA